MIEIILLIPAFLVPGIVVYLILPRAGIFFQSRSVQSRKSMTKKTATSSKPKIEMQPSRAKVSKTIF